MSNNNDSPAIDFRAIFDRAFKKAAANASTSTKPEPDQLAKVNSLLNAMAKERIDRAR